jgi:hypothetical protein
MPSSRKAILDAATKRADKLRAPQSNSLKLVKGTRQWLSTPSQRFQCVDEVQSRTSGLPSGRSNRPPSLPGYESRNESSVRRIKTGELTANLYAFH